MEGKGTSLKLQLSGTEVTDFVRFMAGQPVDEGCLTKISDLPQSYRKEIDRGYSTGWRCVDNYLQGLRKGELTVVTADTGAGKTTFCSQLMVNAAMQGIPVWINSWEMKPATTMRKLASVILRRPLKFCNFSDHDNEQLDTWAKKYCVFINQTTLGTDLLRLSKQLISAKQKGVEIVMLDHLDYLVNCKTEKLHEAIDETMRGLHEMALSLDMHFILVCHPRQTFTSAEEIGLHSLKGSSSIKQYADNIIILHRCQRTDPQADPNKVKIKIAKNRMFGIEGSTFLFYQPKWDGYVELNDNT
jgi:replicative DNA helicase